MCIICDIFNYYPITHVNAEHIECYIDFSELNYLTSYDFWLIAGAAALPTMLNSFNELQGKQSAALKSILKVHETAQGSAPPSLGASRAPKSQGRCLLL